jgi:hypothetical protein
LPNLAFDGIEIQIIEYAKAPPLSTGLSARLPVACRQPFRVFQPYYSCGTCVRKAYLSVRFRQALATVSRIDMGRASQMLSKLVAYARKTMQIIARRMSIVPTFGLRAFATSPDVAGSMYS